MTDNALRVIDGLAEIIGKFNEQPPQTQYEAVLTMTTISTIAGENARSFLQQMYRTGSWMNVELPVQSELSPDGEMIITRTKKASTFAEFLTHIPDLTPSERSLLASLEAITTDINPKAADLSFGVIQTITGPIKALAAIDPEKAAEIVGEIADGNYTVRQSGDVARAALQNAVSRQKPNSEEKFTVSYSVANGKVYIGGEIPESVWYAVFATLSKFPSIICESV